MAKNSSKLAQKAIACTEADNYYNFQHQHERINQNDQ